MNAETKGILKSFGLIAALSVAALLGIPLLIYGGFYYYLQYGKAVFFFFWG